MDVKETITLLTWINQTDPRVMLNQASVERWHNALRTFEYAVAKQSVLEHYKHHEEVPASSAAIYKRAGYIKSSRQAYKSAKDEAEQRAIDAAPRRVKTEADYRRKIRETPEFMALFEEGRRQGNAERAAATERRQVQFAEDEEWPAA